MADNSADARALAPLILLMLLRTPLLTPVAITVGMTIVRGVYGVLGEPAVVTTTGVDFAKSTDDVCGVLDRGMDIRLGVEDKVMTFTVCGVVVITRELGVVVLTLVCGVFNIVVVCNGTLTEYTLLGIDDAVESTIEDTGMVIMGMSFITCVTLDGRETAFSRAVASLACIRFGGPECSKKITRKCNI